MGALEMVLVLVVFVLARPQYAVLVGTLAPWTHARMVMSAKGTPLEHQFVVQRRAMGISVGVVATLFVAVVYV